jgi:hypothetical protein
MAASAKAREPSVISRKIRGRFVAISITGATRIKIMTA